MFPSSQKNQYNTDLQGQVEAQDPFDLEMSAMEEVHAVATSSPAPSVDTPEEWPDAGPPVLSQSLLDTAFIDSNPMSQSDEGSSVQEDDKSTSEACQDPEFSLINTLEKMVGELVRYLIAKYKAKELVTEAEMLKNVIKEQKDYFPSIFKNACECIEVVFGLEVKEVDPFSHSYMLIEMLDLTYYRKLSEEGMPKIGILILILGIIFMEGNRASEEKIWEVLSMLEVFGKEFIYEDPKELIITELVEEQYLECQQVPNSNPPRYVLFWGPKSYAETSKIKVLEFFSKVSGSCPTSFSSLYREALRNEEERAQSEDSAEASEQSKAKSRSISCPE